MSKHLIFLVAIGFSIATSNVVLADENGNSVDSNCNAEESFASDSSTCCRMIQVKQTVAVGGAWAMCASNEYLKMGGADCSQTGTNWNGYLLQSQPVTPNGWVADCHPKPGLKGDVPAIAWAVCCRK